MTLRGFFNRLKKLGNLTISPVWCLRNFRQRPPGVRGIPCLNAGAIFTISGMPGSMREGVALAREIITSGKAIEKLRQWVAVQNSSRPIGHFRSGMARLSPDPTNSVSTLCGRFLCRTAGQDCSSPTSIGCETALCGMAGGNSISGWKRLFERVGINGLMTMV
jgi:hypothetical protein